MKNYYIILILLPLVVFDPSIFAVSTLTYSGILTSPLGGKINIWVSLLISLVTGLGFALLGDILSFPCFILSIAFVNLFMWLRKYKRKKNLINIIRATSSVCIFSSIFVFTTLLELSRADILNYNEITLSKIILDDENFKINCEKMNVLCETTKEKRIISFEKINKGISSTYDKYLSGFISIILLFWVILSECLIWLHINVFLRHKGSFDA